MGNWYCRCNRDYCERDLNWIYYVRSLRQAGMLIESLIEYMKLLHQPDTSPEVRRDLLIDQRDELVQQLRETRQTIAYLSYKIDHFQEHILSSEAAQPFPQQSNKIIDDSHNAED